VENYSCPSNSRAAYAEIMIYALSKEIHQALMIVRHHISWPKATHGHTSIMYSFLRSDQPLTAPPAHMTAFALVVRGRTDCCLATLDQCPSRLTVRLLRRRFGKQQSAANVVKSLGSQPDSGQRQPQRQWSLQHLLAAGAHGAAFTRRYRKCHDCFLPARAAIHSAYAAGT
jgi:hypothetical protein